MGSVPMTVGLDGRSLMFGATTSPDRPLLHFIEPPPVPATASDCPALPLLPDACVEGPTERTSPLAPASTPISPHPSFRPAPDSVSAGTVLCAAPAMEVFPLPGASLQLAPLLRDAPVLPSPTDSVALLPPIPCEEPGVGPASATQAPMVVVDNMQANATEIAHAAVNEPSPFESQLPAGYIDQRLVIVHYGQLMHHASPDEGALQDQGNIVGFSSTPVVHPTNERSSVIASAEGPVQHLVKKRARAAPASKRRAGAKRPSTSWRKKPELSEGPKGVDSGLAAESASGANVDGEVARRPPIRRLAERKTPAQKRKRTVPDPKLEKSAPVEERVKVNGHADGTRGDGIDCADASAKAIPDPNTQIAGETSTESGIVRTPISHDATLNSKSLETIETLVVQWGVSEGLPNESRQRQGPPSGAVAETSTKNGTKQAEDGNLHSCHKDQPHRDSGVLDSPVSISDCPGESSARAIVSKRRRSKVEECGKRDSSNVVGSQNGIVSSPALPPKDSLEHKTHELAHVQFKEKLSLGYALRLTAAAFEGAPTVCCLCKGLMPRRRLGSSTHPVLASPVLNVCTSCKEYVLRRRQQAARVGYLTSHGDRCEDVCACCGEGTPEKPVNALGCASCKHSFCGRCLSIVLSAGDIEVLARQTPAWQCSECARESKAEGSHEKTGVQVGKDTIGSNTRAIGCESRGEAGLGAEADPNVSVPPPRERKAVVRPNSTAVTSVSPQLISIAYDHWFRVAFYFYPRVFGRYLVRLISDSFAGHETFCFWCKTGGNLVHCREEGCPKAFHLECVGYGRPQLSQFTCPWHRCCECGKSKGSQELRRCFTCPRSFCVGCLDKVQVKDVDGTFVSCTSCDEVLRFVEVPSEAFLLRSDDGCMSDGIEDESFCDKWCIGGSEPFFPTRKRRKTVAKEGEDVEDNKDVLREDAKAGRPKRANLGAGKGVPARAGKRTTRSSLRRVEGIRFSGRKSKPVVRYTGGGPPVT